MKPRLTCAEDPPAAAGCGQAAALLMRVRDVLAQAEPASQAGQGRAGAR